MNYAARNLIMLMDFGNYSEVAVLGQNQDDCANLWLADLAHLEKSQCTNPDFVNTGTIPHIVPFFKMTSCVRNFVLLCN